MPWPDKEDDLCPWWGFKRLLPDDWWHTKVALPLAGHMRELPRHRYPPRNHVTDALLDV